MCFFTGGVDSFYTLTKRTGANRIGNVDHIMPVWGFDIPLAKPDEFKVVERMSSDIAVKLDISCIPIVTNLRNTKFSTAPWGYLSHGCGLVGIGLLLEKITVK